MRRRKGVGLGVTLVIVALLAVVGFTLAALTVGRLQLLGNLQHKRQAHRLAISAIEAALGKLNQQPQFGANGNDPAIIVSGGDGQNQARLSFNPLENGASVNNLAGLTSLGGVPAASARLVARSRYGGAQETLEALITQPVFPFALASNGPLHSTQGLIVATLAEDSPSARQNLLSDPARYGNPANLLSNGAGLDSVQILGPSTICGDLQSAGRVDLSGNPIRILGELREDHDPGSIPDIPLSALLPSSPQILASAPTNVPTLRGAVVCNGPFVCSGDLTLEGASLYVKGNLDVGGKLKGSGTLTVEGTTRLHGSADLASIGRVAVVSQGDVILEGAGSRQSYFKGIVYTKGKLTAHGLLVYGCLLGAAPGPTSGPQLDLQDCVVIHDTGPITDGASPVGKGTGNIVQEVLINGQTSASSISVNIATQLFPPDRIRFQIRMDTMATGGGASIPPLTLEVAAGDTADVARFQQEFRQKFPGAGSMEIRFNQPITPVQGPSPTPGAASTLQFFLHDFEQPRLVGQLEDLRRYLDVPSVGNNIFDLNQFLRPNERLRIASCRRIH